MSKKSIAFVLLVFWVFQCSFISLLNEIGRWQCHVLQSARQLDEQDIKLVKHFAFASKEAINWEEEGRELLLNGKLYDVIAIVQSTAQVQITCIPDDNEDAINLAYHRLIHDSGTPKKDTRQQHPPDLKCLPAPGKLVISMDAGIVSCSRHGILIYSAFNPELNSPPPEV